MILTKPELRVKRLVCCFTGILLLTIPVMAKTISISSFLQTAEKDELLQAKRDKSEFLEHSRSNVPLLDKAEVRVQNTGLEIDRNKYEIIFYMAGIGESSASGKYLDAMRKVSQYGKDLEFNKLLSDRYSLILKIISLQKELAVHRQLEMLYHDCINVLSESVNKGVGELTKLIEAREELSSQLTDIAELENDYNDLQVKLRNYLGSTDSIAIDTSNIMPVDSIVGYLKGCKFTIDSSNIHLEHSRLKFEKAKEQYRFEVAKNRKFLNRIELAYDNGKLYDQLQRRDNGKTFDTRKAYSVNLGFDIPFIRGDKLSDFKRKQTYIDDSCEFNDMRADLVDKMQKRAMDVKTLLVEYKVHEDQQSAFNTESALKTFLGIQGVDPIILLRTRESILKSELAKIKLLGKIYAKYLEILDSKGTISQKPLRNYLSANKELIAK